MNTSKTIKAGDISDVSNLFDSRSTIRPPRQNPYMPKKTEPVKATAESEARVNAIKETTKKPEETSRIPQNLVQKIQKNAIRKERRKEAIANKNLEQAVQEDPTLLGRHEYLDEVFTDWDLMVAAKHYPGTINAPFVGSMTTFPTPTGILKNCFTMNQAYSRDTLSFQAMGANTYVCFFYCPLQTVYYGPGGAGNYGTSTKLGGLIVTQTNTGGSTVVGDDWFHQTNYGSSMVQTYGSDASSIASRAFVWASQIDLKIVAPAANIVGTYYEGVINLGQLAGGNLTVNQLIAIAEKVEGGKSGYSLRGSIVNHQLAFWQAPQKPNEGDNDLESVHYVILQTPVMSITTGATTSFSVIANVSSNYLLWPKPSDTFANSIGNSMIQSAINGPKSSAPPAIHQADPMAPQDSGFKSWLSSVFSGETVKKLASSILPTAVGALAGGPIGALTGMASSGLGKSILTAAGSFAKDALVGVASKVFSSSSDSNVGPMASNPYTLNVNPGLAAKYAASTIDYPYEPKRADKIYVSHLVGLKNQISPQYGQGASALTTSSMLHSGNGLNSATYWVNGCDVRYELTKHLSVWNDWPGIAAHEPIWLQIKEQLTTLSSYYDNVDRIPYDTVPTQQARNKSTDSLKRKDEDQDSEYRFRLKP